MKHLFYIHSNVCLKICIEIIKKYNIKNENILFIFNRIKIIDENFHYKKIHTSYFKGLGHLRWNLLKSFYESFKFNKKISNLLKEDNFLIYTPHTAITIVEFLISHNKCRGFYYIEEGAAAYYSEDYINSIVPLKLSFPKKIKRIGWLNKVKTNKFYEFEKSLGVFCTDIKAFPNFDNKVILDSVFKIKGSVFIEQKNTSKDLYCIFDGISSFEEKFRMAHISSFLFFIKKLLSKKDYRSINIKFHPQQYFSGEDILFEKIIRDDLNEIINIKILSQEYVFEDLLNQEVGLDIMILCSSLGIYAKRLDHNVYTFLEKFHEYYNNKSENSKIEYMTKIINNHIK